MGESNSSFANLEFAIRQIFGLPEDVVVLKFKDDQNEEISFSNDLEFDEARRIAVAARKADERALLCVIVATNGGDRVNSADKFPVLERLLEGERRLEEVIGRLEGVLSAAEQGPETE